MQRNENNTIQLGNSGIEVTRVAFGAWPIAGITSLGVDDAVSIQTIRRALECGINFIDTAYSYGYDGRSDRLIREAVGGDREKVVIASKVGTHYDDAKVWTKDARPETIIRQAEETVSRLGTDHVDLLYLHAPDPNVEIEKSAEAIAGIVKRGLAKTAGVSNVSLDQLRRFHAVCPVAAVQTYFNVFQQESVLELRDFCREHSITITCYWVLMKGLLAGRMKRDHRFDPSDRRLTYAVYQGESWERSQDLLDALHPIADDANWSVAQLMLQWAMSQTGVGVAVIGAKRPEQIEETAAALWLDKNRKAIAEVDRLLSV